MPFSLARLLHQRSAASSTIRRPAALTAAMALLAGALTGMPPAGADPAEPSATPALAGRLPSGATVEKVQLLVLPTDPWLRAAEVGTSVRAADVSEAAVVRTDSNTFEVALDPSDVPPRYIDSLGLVHLQIVASTSDGAFLSNASLRAVLSSEGVAAHWAEPAVSAPTTDRPVLARAGRLHLPVDASSQAATVGVTAFAPISEAEADRIAADPDPPAGCDYTKLKEKTRSTTIGTTYPTRGDSATMIVDSSTGAHYGVAVSTKVSGDWADFRAGEGKYTRSGWGFKWANSTKSRSYRKGIRYGLFLLDCVRGCDECSKQWYPIGETGGTGSNSGIDRPNFRRCARVDKGAWWRDDAGEHAYTYGAAVKFAGIIGIDLSISRQYNSSQKLLYRLDAKRRMCGSNDFPSEAGKVMERPRR